MPRPRIAVRDVTAEDLDVVLEMWDELRELSGRSDRTAPPPSAEAVLKAVAEGEGDGETRIVLATYEDQPVGLAVFTVQPLAALLPSRVAQISYLHVRSSARRHGAGRALVAAAASFAEAVGAEHVVASVLPQLREANRFYARLGFSPLVVRRVVPTAVLRRKLGAESCRSAAQKSLVYRRLSARSSVRAAMVRVAERH